ncbi:MAG: tRNA(m(1)G37)methyltransferase [Piccolia ochrophora]|nr:MAG: tRNA(m(1)G37)methyltransferase [Piccolia ochrophora]
MFRPPVNHAMRTLDRTFFRKVIPISAARITDNKNIGEIRQQLSKTNELLRLLRVTEVQRDPEVSLAERDVKCLLLQPEVRHDDTSTWSSKIHEYVNAAKVHLIPFDLTLDYNYWTYHDIMNAILPEDALEEVPSGYSLVGHIAHLNLREQYLPYKTLIATVLLDKIPNVKTVINKTDDVGAESEYRTFGFEVLAGDPNLEVEVTEEECRFRFDYSEVYWNPRLQTEHRRLVAMFAEGDAVCDVMAGVGPFAVPAGKKHVFVWANDLNPASHSSLRDAINRNKVSKFVRAFNLDGQQFIRTSARLLLEETEKGSPIVSLTEKQPRHRPVGTSKPKVIAQFTLPRTFHHYVMNLPDSAITFLKAFIGLYKGQEKLFEPHTKTTLPMIHVHCFSTEGDDAADERAICRRISERIGYTIEPTMPETVIWDVRSVSPKKKMFCASFRLPPEVAFQR